LTRELTYSELLVAVADSESRIDNLKKENENLKARLQQIHDEEDEDGISDEYDGKKKKEQVMREYAEKKYSVEIVTDQIMGWANRVVTKVDEDYHMNKPDSNVRDTFKHICDRVCDALQ